MARIRGLNVLCAAPRQRTGQRREQDAHREASVAAQKTRTRRLERTGFRSRRGHERLLAYRRHGGNERARRNVRRSGYQRVVVRGINEKRPNPRGDFLGLRRTEGRAKVQPRLRRVEQVRALEPIGDLVVEPLPVF